MDLTTEEQKRIEFKKLLLFLAGLPDFKKETPEFKQAKAQIEDLYKDGFRHFYYDIFNTVTEFCNNNNPNYMYTLGGNISVIRTNYKPNPNNVDSSGNIIDVTNCIRKLYDHINLCIAQITYSDAENKKISGEDEIQKIKKQLTDIGAEAHTASISIHKTQDKLKNIQKEYVAILAIFATIVMAFTGSLAFTTSVLENIDSVSIYRVLTVSLIIGLVVSNILFTLFHCINNIIHSNDSNASKQSLGLFNTANTIIIILLIVVVIAWLLGLAEKRDKHINEQLGPQSAITYQIEQSPNP